MLNSPWIYCLWPGLTQSWVYGRWQGLVWAGGFALLLNTALILHGVWPELVGETIHHSIWYVVTAVWATSTGWSIYRVARGGFQPLDESVEALFHAAQNEYLQGQWHQAEATLLRLLTRDPRDAEARLMLATLYRHTQQYDAALDAIAKLIKLDAAGRWWSEIQRERRLLADRMADDDGLDDSDELGDRDEPNESPQASKPEAAVESEHRKAAPSTEAA
ncbi:tetratricopeptide repeat protein [Blastopirellula marina]|uniref:tetratricopeptide repeat protein n=1 Tax=Blastopirellula marina TaxID=124 RepID=UPI0003266E0A|nr:tetratricopeptide repeat protein [Blastopirellula marina]